MPAAIDFDAFQRGNNAPLVWQPLQSTDPDVLFDLSGSEFVLTIDYGGGTIRKDSAVDDGLAVDLTASTVTWTPTLVESRLIPAGKIARYELERRIGGAQRTWATGSVTGNGGLGDD